MPAITGTITVDYVADLVHEIRNGIRSAHRARKRGRPYGPVEFTDGVVRVTLTFVHGGDKPPGKSAASKSA